MSEHGHNPEHSGGGGHHGGGGGGGAVEKFAKETVEGATDLAIGSGAGMANALTEIFSEFFAPGGKKKGGGHGGGGHH